MNFQFYLIIILIFPWDLVDNNSIGFDLDVEVGDGLNYFVKS